MDYKQMFNKLGLKATPARILLYEFLQNKGHITAEEVLTWAKVNFPDFNRATVYNTLNNFEEVGLINKFKLPNSENFIYDTKTHDHFHFVDKNTGEIIDLEPEQVSLDISKLKIKISEVFILGTKRR